MSEMAKTLQEARGSLISDIETLNDLLSSLGETGREWGAGSRGRARLLGPRAVLLAGAGSPARWPSRLRWVPFD